MLLQLIEANLGTLESEKDLLIVKIDLDKYMDRYNPSIEEVSNQVRLETIVIEKHENNQDNKLEENKSSIDVELENSLKEGRSDSISLSQSQRALLQAEYATQNNDIENTNIKQLDDEHSVTQNGPEQSVHLNSFLIFTAFFTMCESIKEIFNFFSERCLEEDGTMGKALEKPRILQLCNALIFTGFFIYGFIRSDKYSDVYLKYQTAFAQEELLMYNKLNATGTYNSTNQYNYTISLEEASKLTKNFSDEYSLFSYLVLLTCAQCFMLFFFPTNLCNPFKIVNNNLRQNAGLVYSLVYGSGTNIFSLIVVMTLSTVKYSEMDEKAAQIGKQEEYQLSEIIGLQFSCGADFAFLYLFYIDAILDDVPVFFALLYNYFSEKCKKNSKIDTSNEPNELEIIDNPYNESLWSLFIAAIDNLLDAFLVTYIFFISGPLGSAFSNRQISPKPEQKSSQTQQSQAKEQQMQDQEQELEVESFNN
eukprot:403363608